MDSSADSGDDVDVNIKTESIPKPKPTKKPRKPKKQRENWEGKSSTITVGFVDRDINEPELCAWLMTVSDVSMPLAVRLVSPNKRYNRDHVKFGQRRAFITMANIDDATKCVQKLHNTVLPMKNRKKKYSKVYVVATAPSNKLESALIGETSWIDFTNLHRDVTEQDLLSLMQKIGVSAQPKTVQLSQHPTQTEWRGRATVQCANAADAAFQRKGGRGSGVGEGVWKNRRDEAVVRRRGLSLGMRHGDYENHGGGHGGH